MAASSGDEHAPAEELLEHFGQVALELSEAEGLHETLQRIVDLGEGLLADCDGVSVMLIGKGGRIETPAYSSQAARDSDMAQYETGEGPCLEAIEERHTIVIEELRTDERWPGYRGRALELGIRSMVSFRLFVTGDSMGALAMCSRAPNAFDQRSHLVGQVFARQASVAMKAALTEAGHQAALESRDVIGQAKGILMARSRMTADMAADTLKQLSQDRNQRLRELAAEIAETGEVPNG